MDLNGLYICSSRTCCAYSTSQQYFTSAWLWQNCLRYDCSKADCEVFESLQTTTTKGEWKPLLTQTFYAIL